MPLDPGAVVSGYRIERMLGSGGMGTVYLARNPSLPRYDALKILPMEFSGDAEFRARFTREADLAAGLDHPNVVTVYTRGRTDDGQLWIAMQYVAGSDADAEVKAGRMTPPRAVAVTAEVARALDYAHQRLLLHRDVKPANFLLAPGGPGEPERVLLADFGIARALDEAAGLTVTGTFVATVAYAAPEIFSGGAVDGRADVYSLGCSLYKMLTGTTPYGWAGNMAGMAAAHLTAPIPLITDRMPALPRALNDVFDTALAKDPAARYPTARDLARAAADALHARPGAPPPGPPRTPPPATRPWSATTPPTPPPPSTPPPRPFTTGPAGPPPAHRPKRRRLAILITLAAVIALAVTGTVIALTRDDGPNAPQYQAQTFVHTHGSTRLDAKPTAVAALGPGDADAVLSLGVQPVVLTAPGGRLPDWERGLVQGNPTVTGAIDVTAVTAAHPDVVIATGDIDDATYTALSAVAPTITRPPDTGQWSWQDRLDWIGRVLGDTERARGLVEDAAARTEALRADHPAFDGKTVQAVDVTDTGITAALSGSNTADYLEAIGFRYADALKRTADDTGDTRPVPDPAALNSADVDVRLVVRTDSAAGSGYNGLPAEFTGKGFKGTTVIVDDPNIVAALTTGGYAATGCLDTALVDAIARQIH
ncbi:serine/threonine-protein kinase [Mycolicibacterium arenosum]|uniref:non-specific serine/threonine protein kinase n=1 Tax=Mycolicibacterium arenosum TaxID=2952157 RepID=A0ABT1MC90_9MYCO|nr:serine/threonine-protein kinase [Mycolicibacterium sp. CAU 1645]MCP9276790.1 serine/threonine-protein kinase [Mycolicibacterium sp. CAU 1645]